MFSKHVGGLLLPPISFNQGGSMQLEILTSQERNVFDLIIEGLSNVEIAEQLIIAECTVKTHLYSISKKLNVKSRNQLMGRVIRELKEQVAILINELFKEVNNEKKQKN